MTMSENAEEQLDPSRLPGDADVEASLQPRTLAEFVCDFKVGVLGYQDASVLVRQGQQEWIGRAVLLGEIKCVDDVMPALLKPERKPTRQLGIDQKVHAARGKMRWTLASRAAKARQALISSRSRSG